jgi:hypothetical protein
MGVRISFSALAAVLLFLQGVSASERVLMQDPVRKMCALSSLAIYLVERVTVH